MGQLPTVASIVGLSPTSLMFAQLACVCRVWLVSWFARFRIAIVSFVSLLARRIALFCAHDILRICAFALICERPLTHSAIRCLVFFNGRCFSASWVNIFSATSFGNEIGLLKLKCSRKSCSGPYCLRNFTRRLL